MPDLAALAQALETATEPSRELDERVTLEVFHPSLAVLPRTECGGWLGELGPIRPASRLTDDVGAILDSIAGKWPGLLWLVTEESRRYGRQSRARLWREDEEIVTVEVEATAAPELPAIALCLAAVHLAATEAAADA